jgi:hypothetical protein
VRRWVAGGRRGTVWRASVAAAGRGVGAFTGGRS